MSELSIYYGQGQRRGNYPAHWMLLVAGPGETHGMWCHLKGGHQQGYRLDIQGGKRLNSLRLASITKLSTISASDINKVREAAQAVPPQYCQSWTVAVLEKLEEKGLVPSGTSSHYAGQVEPDPRDGRIVADSADANTSSGGEK